ncbi:MAG: thiamine phosphate synthase [Treponema sp.]|jgi:thiamine-phosphate pyrophosphorylase|nr:thiamine phosphate synthase [Treponema sp.]
MPGLNPEKDLLLYLCTDRGLFPGPIAGAVEEAIAGGVTMVQIREKDTSTRDFYRIALEVKEVTDRLHIPLVINDRLDIALAAGASGLHIGASDLPLKEARRLAGSMFIGVSASTAEEAVEAERGGADYIGAGAVYPTGSKADAGEAIGIAGLADICAAVNIPVVGIGGVNALNAAEVMKAGASGIAVISAILSQDGIRAAAQALRTVLEAERQEMRGREKIFP